MGAYLHGGKDNVRCQKTPSAELQAPGEESVRLLGESLSSLNRDAPPGEGRPQHSLTAAGAAPIVDASLNGRPPEFDDRARLHDDRCRLQAPLVDHRRQAEGG